MKPQIEMPTTSTGTAGLLRRGALKLLLTAFAVLGTLGTPSQLRAQTVNPGTGILPAEAPEVVQRAGYSPKKKTRMTDLTPAFTTKNGQWVTLRARLYYLDKKGKWQPLGYKPVPVQFEIGSIWMGSANTDRNGWASVTVRIFDLGKIYARGKNINWRATFAGDVELNKAFSGNRFLLMP